MGALSQGTVAAEMLTTVLSPIVDFENIKRLHASYGVEVLLLGTTTATGSLVGVEYLYALCAVGTAFCLDLFLYVLQDWDHKDAMLKVRYCISMIKCTYLKYTYDYNILVYTTILHIYCKVPMSTTLHAPVLCGRRIMPACGCAHHKHCSNSAVTSNVTAPTSSSYTFSQYSIQRYLHFLMYIFCW